MSRERPDLESLLRDAHEPTAPVPPFSRVWHSAVEQQRRRRNRRRLLLAEAPLAAAAILAGVAVLLVPAPAPRGPAPELSELALSLSEVEMPLDFLLEPPVGSLLGVEPPDLGPVPSDRSTTLDFEEIL